MSTMTTSAPRARAAAIASKATEPGSEPSSPRTSSAPARSRPLGQLLGGGGAVGVAGGEDDREAHLLAQVPGDLADRRRLAGAVDADHHQHRRLGAEVDRGAAAAGDLGEDLDQAVAHGDAVGGDGAGLDLVLEPLDHRGGGRGAGVGEDQRLLQPLPGLVVDAVEEAGRDLLGQRLAAFREALAQAA